MANETFDQVNAIIDNARTVADDKIEQSDDYLQSAISAAGGYALADLAVVVDSIALPTIPETYTTEDLSAVYESKRDSMWSDLDQYVQDSLNGWMEAYAPKLDDCIQPYSDTWLCGTLNGERLGIPRDAENQIWERGRAREGTEAIALEQAAIDSYAARGFIMPPGSLAAKIAQIQTANSLKSATYEREVTIKQAELTLDLSKHAISLTTQLRLGVAQALGEFIRAAIAIPTLAGQQSTSVIESKEALWKMISAMVQGKIASVNLDLQRKLGQADINTKLNSIFVQDLQFRHKTIAETALKAAETVATIAANAINSQQTLANVTYQTDESI